MASSMPFHTVILLHFPVVAGCRTAVTRFSTLLIVILLTGHAHRKQASALPASSGLTFHLDTPRPRPKFR